MRELLDGLRAGPARGRDPGDPRARRRHPALRGRDRPHRSSPTAGSTRDGDAYRPVGDLGRAGRPGHAPLAHRQPPRRAGARRPERSSPTPSVLGQTFTAGRRSPPSAARPRDALEPRLARPRPARAARRRDRSRAARSAASTASSSRSSARSPTARWRKRERRARHLAAARYFEALGDDELAGLLASHYLAAHEASAEGAEADAVAIQARLALSGAAERAATLGAHDQAVSYLRQAIAITADPGGARRAAPPGGDVGQRRRAPRRCPGARPRRGSTSPGPQGDPQAAGAGEALLGEILIDSGQPLEAVAGPRGRHRRVPRDRGAGRSGPTILANLSRALMRTGQPARAIQAADLALDLAEHLGLERIVAETFNNKGSSLGQLGRRREGLALLQAAVDVAHAGGFVAAEIRAMSNLGGLDRRSTAGTRPRTGRPRSWPAGSATETWRDGLQRQARFQDYVLADGWDAALAEGADDRADDAGSPLDEVRRIAISTVFLLARGEPTDAALARLEVLSTQVSDPFAVAAVHSVRSDRALHAGDYALAAMRRCSPPRTRRSPRSTWPTRCGPPSGVGDLARAREVTRRLEATRRSGSASRPIGSRPGPASPRSKGRLDEAIAGYRDALSRHRSIGAALDLARIALDFVLVVGADHPATREAAAEARSDLRAGQGAPLPRATRCGHGQKPGRRSRDPGQRQHGRRADSRLTGAQRVPGSRRSGVHRRRIGTQPPMRERAVCHLTHGS